MTNLVSKDELDRMFADYNDELANKVSSINGGGNMRKLRSQAYKKRKNGTIRAAGITDHNGHRIRSTYSGSRRGTTRSTRARRTFNGGGGDIDKYDPNKKVTIDDTEYTQQELLRMTNAPPGYTARSPALDRYFKSLYGQNRQVQPTSGYDSGDDTEVVPSDDGPFNGSGRYDPNEKVKIGDEEYTRQELLRMTNVPPGYTARTPALDRYFKNISYNRQAQQPTRDYDSGEDTDVAPPVDGTFYGGGGYDPDKKVKIGDEEYTQRELLRMTNAPPGYSHREPINSYVKRQRGNKYDPNEKVKIGDEEYTRQELLRMTNAPPGYTPREPFNGHVKRQRSNKYDPNEKVKIGDEEYTRQELLRMTNAPPGYTPREPLNSYYKRQRSNKYNPNEKVNVGDDEYTQRELLRMTNAPPGYTPREPFKSHPKNYNIIPGGGMHKYDMDDDVIRDMHSRYNRRVRGRGKVLYPARLRGGAVAGRKNSVVFD